MGSRPTYEQLMLKIKALEEALALSCAPGASGPQDAVRRQIVERSRDGVAVVRNSVLECVNEHLPGILDRTGEELLGTRFTEYLHPDELETVKARFSRFTGGDEPEQEFTTAFLRRDGSRIDAQVRLCAIQSDRPGACLVFLHTIAERTHAVTSLHYRAWFERLITGISTSLLTLSPEALGRGIERILKTLGEFTEVDRTYVFLYSNDGATMDNTHEWCSAHTSSHRDKFTGVPIETFPWANRVLRNGDVLHLRNVDDIPAEALREKQEFETGRVRSLLNIPMSSKGTPLGFLGFDSVTREKHWTEETIALMTLVAEMLANALTRTRAEEALRQSEERFRNAFGDAALGMALLSPAGSFLVVNTYLCTMLGYSREELLARTLDEVAHPEDMDLHPEGRRKLLDGEISSLRQETRYLRKNGDVLWGMLSCSVQRDAEGRPRYLIAHIQDITERKRLEVQLRQSQKLEALGTLAGGIAHDFNNILMGIQGNASLMLLDICPPDVNHERLTRIEQYVQNGAELTKQLLGFARAGKYEVLPTDVNHLLRQSSRMFARTRKQLTIHSSYKNDLWSVMADRGQLEHVFMNIFLNAAQAMPHGGDLYLASENVILDAPEVNGFGLETGSYVKISVTDTGEGMDSGTQEKVFDPFFTTREVGKGSGLGLASAYGIVKNHGGMIRVRSDKGHGTTILVYLPASVEDVQESHFEEERLRTGSGTILLIDDEEMILDVGKKMLESLGYHVHIADSGKEAVRIYTENAGDVDLVILDMIMPDMGGGDTYERLKRLDPHVKVILSSGYSIEGEAREILEQGCHGFIQKPFTMQQLSEKIVHALDGA